LEPKNHATVTDPKSKLLTADISNSNFREKKIGDTFYIESEICVARSLFEALCVREGELYLPDSFLQLSEISEIISALRTVSL